MQNSILLHNLRRSLRPRDSVFHPRHSAYKWFLLANVMLGTFMAVMDATIVNVGLPKIMASFGVNIDTIQWVINGYMLAMAVMLPTSGWLADKFGYKLIYFLGLFLFTFGSLMCGLSRNEDMLIFSRVIQGLGGGMVQPLGMAIVMHEFPPEKRGVALGFWVISAAASVSFGPLIGGYLIDNFNWPLIFGVNVPVGIFALFATFVIQEEYKSASTRKFDLVGFISVTTFFPVLIYALSEGTSQSNSQGWHAPYILLLFAISVIALTVFLITELTVKEPLIDLKLLMDRNFGISNLIMFMFGIGVFGGVFLLPLYLQNSLGYTALQSGMVFLPVGIIQGAIAPVTGIFADKVSAKIPVIIGLILFSISFYIFSKLSFMTEHNYIMMSLYLRGVAMGMMFTSLSTISLYDISREKMAQASSMLNTIRQLGGSMGVAIMATILTSRFMYHRQMFGGSIQANSVAYHGTLARLGNYIQLHIGSSHAVAAKLSQQVLFSDVSKQAYIEGINDVFLIATAVTIIGIIPVLFLHEKKKKQKQQNQSNKNYSYE